MSQCVGAFRRAGGADNPVFSDYSSYGFRGCLTKPYNLPLLKKTLDRLLNRRC